MLTRPTDQSDGSSLPAAFHSLLEFPVAFSQIFIIYIHAKAPQLLQRGTDHMVTTGLLLPPGRRLQLGGLGVVRRHRHAPLPQVFIFLSAVRLLKATRQLTLRLKYGLTSYHLDAVTRKTRGRHQLATSGTAARRSTDLPTADGQTNNCQ